MKCASFFLLAAIAFSATNAASSTPIGNLRGLQTGPEALDFAAVNQVASFNGLHAGEQILKAVNDAFPDDDKVNGDQLFHIATRLLNKDATLETADKSTQGVVAAIHKAVEKLFPGEDFNVALGRVLSKIPSPAAARRLAEGSPLESINFSDVNQVASFNGLHAGEEILKAVNDAFPDDDKVDGDQLLSVAKRLLSKDATLDTADKSTKGIVAAIHKAFEKLFPGEVFDDALRRVLTTLPK